ncbi:PQQ-dependent catabolism-associated CXXCW motif protein [Mongoliimonas terrestris]|uniref:PQQ-dependent catabolism-associated CXXCW motif protein n=1 Tax=Mongoliimonas terrestris TaxID=1709001 RepID=UPI000949A70E|nr:PQQ-dependent catabolism-associated CXXCW motif protein [Mongoliimonas terrestris]
MKSVRRFRDVVAAGLVVAGCLFPLVVGHAAAGEVPEPSDYRMDDYRAPVPNTLAGARVLDTAAVAALWKAGGAVFIDVLPKLPRPDLPPGTVFRLPARNAIPGSMWLPDVGYGALSDEMAAYFREELAAATGGDPTRTVLFYCLADCWMSWNAARRALEWGYSDVAWYPEGTDGWAFDGLPLEEIKPVPRPGITD